MTTGTHSWVARRGWLLGIVVLAAAAVCFLLTRDVAPPVTAHTDQPPSVVERVGERASGTSIPERVETAPRRPPDAAGSGTAAPDRPGVVEVVVLHADRSPAEGVWVSLVASDERAHAGRSDTRGRLILSGVAAGSATVWNDRDTEARATTVQAAATTTCEILLAGRVITGRVVDGVGIGIAEAWVVFEGIYAGATSAVVARTASDGSFTARSVPVDGVLWATGTGFGPSATLDGRALVEPVQFVLRNRGGAVQGRVVDPRNVGVERAVVAIGTPEFRTLTDADGNFRIDGLTLGATKARIRARGFTPWTVDLDVQGDSTELFAELQPGGRCRGTVRDARGEPVAGARVVAQEPGVREVAVSTTRADGTFELGGLPLGMLEFEVDAGPRGRAIVQLEVRTDEVLAWDPRLVEAQTLRGRVATQDGTGVGGVVLRVTSEEPAVAFGAQCRTDAEGRFALEGVGAPRVRIDVEHAPLGLPLAVVRRVDPAAGDVAIQIDAAHVPSAYVRAAIRGPDGEPLTAATVAAATFWLLGPTVAGQLPQALGSDGLLVCGPLPPAVVEIAVTVPGHATWRSGTRRLGAGETWDLGIVRVQRE